MVVVRSWTGEGEGEGQIYLAELKPNTRGAASDEVYPGRKVDKVLFGEFGGGREDLEV